MAAKSGYGINNKFGEDKVPISKKTVDVSKLNQSAVLPYELRLQDFQMAMQDIYDFFTMLTST